MRILLYRAMKPACLILAIIVGISSSVLAETASIDEMKLVCSNWLAYMTFQKGRWAGSANPEIVDIQDIVENDTILARSFVIKPSGYVVVPILKDLPPVKAYSEEYGLDLSAPDGFPVMLKEVLLHRIRLFVDIYGSLEATQPNKGDVLLGRQHRLEWDRFLQSEEAFDADLAAEKFHPLEELGPILTTSWDQDDPYNQLCPMGDGGRCVVGCVATATSQILAYHKWPPEGTGSFLYYWSGDNSCEGSTPGAYLSADFDDPYDWDNIPDNCNVGCTDDEQNALSELCYEVGVAFRMDYGRCGSGAYTADGQTVFPTFFRYHDWIERRNRSDYGISVWSDFIKTEIEAERPFQYRIHLHSIVGDGWRQVESLDQVHMNYGWGGGHNAWYTIDDLHCPWEGCTPTVEFMLANIVPDKGVFLTADTTWGYIPLDVSFSGNSEHSVDSWTWDFGDGDSAFIQSPMHSYTAAGRYDVTLQVAVGEDIFTYATTNYITALADSLISVDAQGEPDSTVEVVISVRNTVPLRKMKIPVEYAGSLNLAFDSFSTAGCRTEHFDYKKHIHFDPANKRSTYSLYNTDISTADLEPGSGAVLKLYFTIPASATSEQTSSIILDGYGSHFPMFYGPVLDYAPILWAGTVSLSFVCGDANGDGNVNLLDITFLIEYLYREGPAPVPLNAGDANGDGPVNLLDITYLINYLYRGGPEPVC